MKPVTTLRRVLAVAATTAVVAVLVVSAWWRVGKVDVDAAAVARCMAGKATAEQALRWGEQFGFTQALLLDRWAALGCEGGWQVAANSQLRHAVADELTRTDIFFLRAFREGYYRTLLGPRASQAQRKAVAEVALFLEEARLEQRKVLECGLANEKIVATAAQYDWSFSVAALGARADLADPEIAQQVADRLNQAVSVVTAMLPALNCATATDERFRLYASHMTEFLDGRHAWAPGCFPEHRPGGEIVLRCVGAQNATR